MAQLVNTARRILDDLVIVLRLSHHIEMVQYVQVTNENSLKQLAPI
jgi:hypothetical protein